MPRWSRERSHDSLARNSPRARAGTHRVSSRLELRTPSRARGGDRCADPWRLRRGHTSRCNPRCRPGRVRPAARGVAGRCDPRPARRAAHGRPARNRDGARRRRWGPVPSSGRGGSDIARVHRSCVHRDRFLELVHAGPRGHQARPWCGWGGRHRCRASGRGGRARHLPVGLDGVRGIVERTRSRGRG